MIKFSEDHEWISLEGDVATIGITDFARMSWATLCLLICRNRAQG